jgi:4-amino-4-deoxy-L-arabinose transferase-like glycosyltransferase
VTPRQDPYAFTKKLWHSDVVAGFAALMFVVARGVAFDAVALISADFLFTVLTLVYFWILLDCLREDRHWFLLGCVHGIAFLVKAFALPWLTLVTVGAVLASSGKKDRLKRLAAAATIPILASALWASALHSKYGSFTTGTQFRTNLLQWTLREYRNHRPDTYSALLDISPDTDDHMVTDPMAPHSWGWSYKLSMRRVFPKIIQAERSNLPVMMKDLAILSNPGILLGLALLLAFSLRSKGHGLSNEDSRTMIIIVVMAAASLVFAYCMLVVDERYRRRLECPKR